MKLKHRYKIWFIDPSGKTNSGEVSVFGNLSYVSSTVMKHGFTISRSAFEHEVDLDDLEKIFIPPHRILMVAQIRN